MRFSADHALKIEHSRERAAGMLQKCWNALTRTVVRPGLRRITRWIVRRDPGGAVASEAQASSPTSSNS